MKMRISSFTDKARAIRLHEHGKVLGFSRTAGGVVDDEVSGPNVKAGVAVEDAERPQEVAMPSVSIRIRMRHAMECLNFV